MTCWKCNTFFCWSCKTELSRTDPYKHYQDPKSVCFEKLYEFEDEDEDDDDEGIDPIHFSDGEIDEIFVIPDDAQFHEDYLDFDY